MEGSSPAKPGTRVRILDVAERLVQTRGFNGFSYADVATELSVTTAGIHHHFPSKAALGDELVRRYASRFGAALARIDAAVPDVPGRLRAYSDLYKGVLRDDRMCLCGMLASEYRTLPTSLRHRITEFFELNEAWLEGVLETGRAEGTVSFAGSAREAARFLVAGLEGAMLLAHALGDAAAFDSNARRLVGTFIGPREDTGRRGRRTGTT